ncbi:hypothetical protein CLV71_101147 [Actinophytocola oryzae]|uniref:DUF5753 domain-containing protein n=2 Tax=Actinophytocola oryzae TaxID=502181 RepID=A0A4R7W3Q2_9PSEU|nr:hypothetical protein CLV71_101147 [Actinophytocola oryzae]
MERRQVLYRSHAARFTFYLHEQALQLRVGTDQEMHEQLLHLVLTAALANVTVRVVPTAAGVFGDAFHLMELDQHWPIVYLGGLRFGGLILEDPDYVNSYRGALKDAFLTLGVLKGAFITLGRRARHRPHREVFNGAALGRGGRASSDGPPPRRLATRSRSRRRTTC